MTALNMRTVTVTRPVRPLVVALPRGWYAWVEHGTGWTLDTRGSGTWQPMVDVPGIGGHVLQPAQVAALVLAYGRPTPS